MKGRGVGRHCVHCKLLPEEGGHRILGWQRYLQRDVGSIFLEAERAVGRQHVLYRKRGALEPILGVEKFLCRP